MFSHRRMSEILKSPKLTRSKNNVTGYGKYKLIRVYKCGVRHFQDDLNPRNPETLQSLRNQVVFEWNEAISLDHSVFVRVWIDLQKFLSLDQ